MGSEHCNNIVFQNDTKPFVITLERASTKTCLRIDWGDDKPYEFFGNLASCIKRLGNIRWTL